MTTEANKRAEIPEEVFVRACEYASKYIASCASDIAVKDFLAGRQSFIEHELRPLLEAAWDKGLYGNSTTRIHSIDELMEKVKR